MHIHVYVSREREGERETGRESVRERERETEATGSERREIQHVLSFVLFLLCLLHRVCYFHT